MQVFRGDAARPIRWSANPTNKVWPRFVALETVVDHEVMGEE